jgi:hypothetical protein
MYPFRNAAPIAILFALATQLMTAVLWAAPISTCVEATSKTSLENNALELLVRTELAHFPSHRLVDAGCSTVLQVEVFPFAEKNFVTLRITGEVPVRYAYDNTDALIDQIKKGLQLVLGNDPVYLQENISQYVESRKALHTLSIAGNTHFRLELYESIVRTPRGASYAPGIATGIVKGSQNLFIYSRIHVSAALPSSTRRTIRLPISVGVDAGFTYEFNRTRPAAGYLGGGVGLTFMQFEGTVDNRSATANALLLQGVATAGIRMFRLTEFNMNLFISGYLPFYPSSDVDSPLLGAKGRAYTPQIQAGAGVTF